MDGLLLEKMDVNNGLRQGCCCAVMERWKEKVAGKEGVGVVLNFKFDQ